MISSKKNIAYILFLSVVSAVGCGSAGSGNSSVDNGIGYSGNSQSKNLSRTNNHDSGNPIVTADSKGNVYIVWEELVPDANHISREIYFTQSSDYGNTFNNKQSLSSASEKQCHIMDVDSNEAAISAGANNNLYLAWKFSWSMPSNGTGIKFFSPEDSECYIVSDIYSDAQNPKISVDGKGKVHVVWEEYRGGQKDIFYRRSDDSGNSLIPKSTPLNISGTTSSDSSEPALSFDGPLPGFDGSINVNVVWVEGNGGTTKTINFSRSENNGNIFVKQEAPISDTGINSYCPRMATHNEGNIYIAYKGTHNSGNNIYFTRWDSASSSFSEPQKISDGSSSPSCPEISVGSNGVIYVAWADLGDVWTATSVNSGYEFSHPVNVSNTPGVSSSAKLVTDGNFINYVWVEEINASEDIYFSGSRDNGQTFSIPINLSNTPASPSTLPSVYADGSKYIYVAWTEGVEGNREIYFVRHEGAK